MREHFERIHASFTKLPVTELVPVPGWPEVVLSYVELLIFERNNVAEITKVVGEKVIDLNVKELLDGVDILGVNRDHSLVLRGDIESWFRRPQKETAFILRTCRVFISYSQFDQQYLEQLRFALVPYERRNELFVWADPLIEPGQEWHEKIFTNLDDADIFILLLSLESVASKFVMEEELPRAETLPKEGKCEIVPILIRPCGWEKLDLARVQTIRPDGKAVSQARNRDVAWQQVMEELNKVIARIREKKG